jgi:hypothetical protein
MPLASDTDSPNLSRSAVDGAQGIAPLDGLRIVQQIELPSIA